MKNRKILIVLLLVIIINFIVMNVNASPTPEVPEGCSTLFNKESGTGKYISDAFTIIRWGASVALIILGSMDFGKAVMGGKEEDLKEASKKMVTRIIIAIAIFMSPAILNLFLALIDSSTCGF